MSPPIGVVACRPFSLLPGPEYFSDNAQVTPNDDPRAGITNNEVQDDLTVDISGAYTPGVTDFSAEAFIDAITTAGDSQEDFTTVMMHSIVYARAQKNNLIDFVPDSVNADAAGIPTFLGRRVIVDDSPCRTRRASSIPGFSVRRRHDGALVIRRFRRKSIAKLSEGNGGGSESLWSRIEWSMHPVGYRLVRLGQLPIPDGGPDNSARLADGPNNWARTFPRT